MSKQWKPGKKPVDITEGPHPSRIRRDPPAPVTRKSVRPYPSEREVLIVVIGVILFALAISSITVGLSQITSH